ncbi:DUF4188 domain-containing protein [Pseudonocardia phyllosphaerae]|uniref:DUF4188 domain-containing protein n=1 Tax=Pseudonocardia phyllosphaerae TaxID=3390502 RepID=UPI00397BA422
MAPYTRTTHATPADGTELVVFLIGMRIRKPWRVDAWAPVAAAMPRMLKELSADPASGLLGYRLTLGEDGPLVIQYWRDHESLYGYARAADRRHRPAWAAFNRRARSAPGAVGIWHETFVVAASETIYGDMPASGLAKALGVRSLDPASTAAARLAGPAPA